MLFATGAPAAGAAASVNPVPRRIHSVICRAVRCTDGSDAAFTTVAAVIANASPVPASTSIGTGTSAGPVGRSATGGGGTVGCDAAGAGAVDVGTAALGCGDAAFGLREQAASAAATTTNASVFICIRVLPA